MVLLPAGYGDAGNRCRKKLILLTVYMVRSGKIQGKNSLLDLFKFLLLLLTVSEQTDIE
jgi:hypothetical protein